MSATDSTTTIPVSESIRDELWEKKESSTDTYTDVLARLLEGEQ